MAKDTRLAPPELREIRASLRRLIPAVEDLIRALDGHMTLDAGKSLDHSAELLFARLELEEIVRQFRESGILDDSI